MHACASTDIPAATISFARYRHSISTGAVMKRFQLWPVCSSRHCHAQKTDSCAGRKKNEENSVCCVQRLYQPFCSTSIFPR